jgi:Zinc-binding dehydrogenase
MLAGPGDQPEELIRPGQVEAVLPFDQVREALERVAGGHTRGKIVLQIG